MTKKKIYKITLTDLIMLKQRNSTIKAVVENGDLISIKISPSEEYIGIVIYHDDNSILVLTKNTNKLKWFSKYVIINKL